MRIVDKYLLREFAWPVLYCFDAFAMLMIVIDLFSTLDEFTASSAPFINGVHYYLIKFPEFFVQIMPMALLLGLLFCLANLSKYNELTAMRASGISLFRLAVPLLAVGLAATGVVFAVNELFVPHAREKADALRAKVKGKSDRDWLLENFFFADPAEHRDWYARRFDTRHFEMDSAEIHDRKPDGTPVMDIYAERARWLDNQWHFYNADVYDHRQTPPLVRVSETNFPAFKESPRRLAVEGKKPDQLTTSELRRYIRTQRRANHLAGLAKYEVELHARFAFPLTCLIVVLIGIPLGMRVSRSGPLLGVGTALTLVVSFYFLNNITLALGNGGRIPAAAAAWMTNAIFAGVGLVLLARAR